MSNLEKTALDKALLALNKLSLHTKLESMEKKWNNLLFLSRNKRAFFGLPLTVMITFEPVGITAVLLTD